MTSQTATNPLDREKIPLLILGDGTFALETLDIAESTGRFSPLGFVNSMLPPPHAKTLAGLPIFFADALPLQPMDCWLVAAMISTARHAFIDMMSKRHFRFTSIIHPSAVISKRAHIGSGCIINALSVISHHATIGNHTIINRGALIGHDTRIAGTCTIGPGANLCGNVTIGDRTTIGASAVALENLTIEHDAVIAAGAVVTTHVPANARMMGIPAKNISRS